MGCLFTFMYLVFSLIFFNFTIANSTSSMLPLCHDDERSALLQFKESHIIINETSSSYPCLPKAASWKPEKGKTDCCSWDGVECNEETGHVIKLDLSSSCIYGSINSSSRIFHLAHLEWLNLAYNDFNGSEIPFGIIKYSRLSYLNLSFSSFSGQIPLEILELSNLVSLDLSVNSDLQLQKPSLENLVEKLTNLKELHLDDVTIASRIPHKLANLSSLTFLSLSGCKLRGRILSSLSNLTKLDHLDLSDNELSGEFVNWNLGYLKELDFSFNGLSGKLPTSIGNLSSLEVLYLSENKLWGELPTSIGNLTSLEILDLSGNKLRGKLPNSIENLVSLKIIDLSFNRFFDELPSFIGKLGSLEFFIISNCNFSGQIPSSLGNLTHLRILGFASNNFLGELPAFIGNLRSLEILDIAYCKFSGQLPTSLANMTHLRALFLRSNNFFGEFPDFIGNIASLESLCITSCNFSGQIPLSLGNLTQLRCLYLSKNGFVGKMDLDMLLINLKNLNFLTLSSNRLSLLTKATSNTTSKNIVAVGLRSCNLTEFPNFLKNQPHLELLDLSSNRIHGKVPKWFLNPHMQKFYYLNLSHNLLTGFDQYPVVLPWNNSVFLTLDLSSNYLQGPLPVPQPQTKSYLVSNNSLTGQILSWICNLKSLSSLDMSGNNLSGELPQCLGNFSDSLSLLDLEGNKFSGSIPQTFLRCKSLRMVDLSDNQLQGRIPRSMANCSKLEFLDLGNNQIGDTFPSWLGTLSDLNVLILKSNKLHGIIREPTTDCGFPKLRIIDLSANRFTGKLPSKYFQCWNGMKVVNTSHEPRYMQDNIFPALETYAVDFGIYGYSLTMSNKGRMMAYDKIPDILTGIILSSNRFDGEIPTSISILKELQVLSLANNNLHGPIPSCLGNLKEMESLDLSNNNFSGQIPRQLVELTFLEFFNVSDNHLTGPIPQGKQFDTFDNSSFDGNLGLCGKPLSKECENSEATTKEDHIQGSEYMSSDAFDWKIILIGYSGGLIVGVVLGLNFSTGIVEWFLEKFGMPSKKMRRNRRRRNSI